MHYGKIKNYDIANGTGVRVSLFVSGCRNHCKGCFQPETWDFKYGNEFTLKEMQEILDLLEPNHISGLSILGGDPFEPENREQVLDICRWVKNVYPKKTIWMYTGYRYEDLKDLEVFKYIDVLVDGPFKEELRDVNLKFRGSRNQRIIYLREGRIEQ